VHGGRYERLARRGSQCSSQTWLRPVVPSDGGVDGAVELVGTNTLPDTLKATRRGGVVCFTGMLSDQWTIQDFYPMDYIPNGVRLRAYHGEAVELPGPVPQRFLDDVATGNAVVPIGHVYRMDEIVAAHHDMERGTYAGKLVVMTPSTSAP